MKLYPFKFQVNGSPLAGKFVFNLEDNAELYLDITFQPFTKDSEQVCFVLRLKKGRTLLQVLRAGITCNHLPPPADFFELQPGCELARGLVTVQILECPHNIDRIVIPTKELPKVIDQEKTRVLDLKAMASTTPAYFSEITRELEIIPAAVEAEKPPVVFAPIPDLTPMPDSDLQPAPAKSPASAAPAAPRSRANLYFAMGFTGAFFIGLACGVGVREISFSSAHALDAKIEPVEIPSPVAEAPAQMPAPAAVEAPAPEAAIAAVAKVAAAEVAAAEVAEAAPVAEPEQIADAEESVERAPSSIALPEPALSTEQFARLFTAIQKNRLEDVQAMMEKEKLDAAKILDKKGRTPLAQAASFGHVKMVQYFSGKADVNARDYEGNTPLMWAVMNAREKTVKTLLQLGANPKLKRKDGADALTLASNLNQARLVKILSKK